MRRFLSRLRYDCSGLSMVEFALLGPVFLIMLLGVLQFGIAMQNYNALRSVSAEVARYAMIQYQTGNTISNNQIRAYAIAEGQGTPYLLRNRQLNALVHNAGTQRVEGARELQLTMSYQIDSILEFAGIEAPFITYSRPIFLVN